MFKVNLLYADVSSRPKGLALDFIFFPILCFEAASLIHRLVLSFISRICNGHQNLTCPHVSIAFFNVEQNKIIQHFLKIKYK